MEIFKLFGSIFLKSDEADKTLDKFDKKAMSLDKKMAQMGKSVTNAGKTMTTFVSGPLLAVGGAVLGLATNAGKAADRLLDLKEISGMSTDAIQEYQHVAKIAGVSTEAVTKAAEGFIKKLPQLQKEGGAVAEIIKNLGVNTEGTADQIMDSMLVALSAIEDPMERNSQGAQLFGGAWKDLAPILGMGADGIEAARKEAQALGLVLGEDALNDANNFRIEIDKLKASFGAMFLQIGAKLAPMLQETLIPLIQEKVIPAIMIFTDRVGVLVDWFSNLDGTTQTVILAVGGFLAALGPLLIIIGKVITISIKLIPLFKALGVVIAFLTSPIGLVILAIGVLVATFIYLWKTNEKFRDAVTKIWDGIKKMFGTSLDWIKEKIQVAFNWIKAFWDKWGEAITIYFTTAWKLIVNTFKTYIDIIVNAFKFFVALFKGDWQGMWDAIRGILSAAWNGLSNSFNYIVKAIVDIFNSLGIDVKGKFTAIWDSVKDVTSKAWEGIKNVIKKPIDWIMEQIEKVMKQVDRVKSAASAITGAASNVAGKVSGAVSGVKSIIPGLATGGNITRAGSVIVGESGPEFLDLPIGARVTPLDKAGNGIVINVNNPHLFNERDADRLGQLLVGRVRTATGLRI